MKNVALRKENLPSLRNMAPVVAGVWISGRDALMSDDASSFFPRKYGWFRGSGRGRFLVEGQCPLAQAQGCLCERQGLGLAS